MIYKNILEGIGNTPMIDMSDLVKNDKVDVYAKLEGNNPSGSIKDRVALYMIKEAERRGKLKKDMEILEATSGNMGIALAMIGAVKGYRVNIIMSELVSAERRALIRGYGAKLILTDAKSGTEGALEKARKMVSENPKKYWFADQFNNEDNTLAHYYGVAREVYETVGGVDYIILGAGTSGTMMGLKKFFAEHSPQTKIVNIVPPGGYKVQGIQNPDADFGGEIWDREDENVINIDNDVACNVAREIMQKTGVSVGMSSGANLAGVRKIARDISENSRIVTIFSDRGEKYVSTELFVN